MKPTYAENVYVAKLLDQQEPRRIAGELFLLYLLGMSLVILFSSWALQAENPCDPATAGTDYWYEVCLNEGEIDLGADREPIIEPTAIVWEA